MTAAMEVDWSEEGDYPLRCCPRCNKPIEDKWWDYAWCEDCTVNGTCRHGNKPEECNECLVEMPFAND